MNNSYYLIGLVVVIAAIISVLSKRQSRVVTEYRYSRKKFFMSAAEHKFYDILISIVGHNYYVFAQVHLPTILDHKVTGQNWRGAFRHIDEKSIDFVLCDKAYISPVLAIELDDSSHTRTDRQERDKIVEQMLDSAGLPLLRFKAQKQYNPAEISQILSKELLPHTGQEAKMSSAS